MDDVEYQISCDVGDENSEEALTYYRQYMKKKWTYFHFYVKYECDEEKCRGWSGTDNRCDCDSNRVMWKWRPGRCLGYLYAEAY